MMRIEELELLIQKACWFEHLGEPLTNRGFVQVSSLGPWAKLQTGDDELEEIANQMEWLPSSREQTDPIHGSSMEERSAQGGKSEEYSRGSLDIYKKTAASLRHFEGLPALKIGPHDFT